MPKNYTSRLFHNGTHVEFGYTSFRYCKTTNPKCKDLSDPAVFANFTSYYGDEFTANIYF